MDSSSSPILWLQSSSTSDLNQPPPNPNPNPKPKLKRSGKSPAASSATKRAPQRGLGVAQLERIRLQEKIKKLPYDHQIQTFPLNLPSICEQQQVMDQSFCRYGAPICYMPQYRVNFGHVSAIRSVLHEQYAMDRVRIGAGSLVNSELPSNQTATVCVSDQCDFCVRRKRMMTENQWICCGNGLDHQYLLMSEEKRNVGATREKEIKEYEFFPQNSNESKSEISVVGASASLSSAYGHGSANFVDLSLKLSND